MTVADNPSISFVGILPSTAESTLQAYDAYCSACKSLSAIKSQTDDAQRQELLDTWGSVNDIEYAVKAHKTTLLQLLSPIPEAEIRSFDLENYVTLQLIALKRQNELEQIRGDQNNNLSLNR